MPMYYRLAGACAVLFAVCGQGHAQTATIDGFTVTSLTAPERPSVPVAAGASFNPDTPRLNSVLYLTKGQPLGSSPYSGSLQDHAAYLSIQANSRITFALPPFVSRLKILWGSLGGTDMATFYNQGSKVGVLQGNDLASVYGLNTNNYFSISSPVPFDVVVLSSETCCFEFSDLSAE